MATPQQLAQQLMVGSGPTGQQLNMVSPMGGSVLPNYNYQPSALLNARSAGVGVTNPGVGIVFQNVSNFLDKNSYAPKINPNVTSMIPKNVDGTLQYNDALSNDYYKQMNRPLYLAGPTNSAAINDMAHELSKAGPIGSFYNSLLSWKPTQSNEGSWGIPMWQQFADKLNAQMESK